MPVWSPVLLHVGHRRPVTRELLEPRSGVGRVQRIDTGEFLGPIPYRLTVYREIIKGVSRKQVLSKLLDLEPVDDVFGVVLRMTLEDGLEIDFFVADLE